MSSFLLTRIGRERFDFTVIYNLKEVASIVTVIKLIRFGSHN